MLFQLSEINFSFRYKERSWSLPNSKILIPSRSEKIKKTTFSHLRGRGGGDQMTLDFFRPINTLHTPTRRWINNKRLFCCNLCNKIPKHTYFFFSLLPRKLFSLIELRCYHKRKMVGCLLASPGLPLPVVGLPSPRWLLHGALALWASQFTRIRIFPLDSVVVEDGRLGGAGRSSGSRGGVGFSKLPSGWEGRKWCYDVESVAVGAKVMIWTKWGSLYAVLRIVSCDL